MTLGFEDLRQGAKEEWNALKSSQRPLILVGTATCGRSAGSLEVLETLRRESQSRGIDCSIIEVGCIGLCYAEPIVCITRPPNPGICYGNVTPQRAIELVDEYLVKGEPLPDYVLGTFGEGNIEGIPRLFETPVFKRQVRRTLKNCGFIDPTNIKHYLAHDGYTGFSRALGMSPEQIIDEIKRSGLRGRGGAGFPTWQKWEFCRGARSEEKYLICNADEGDPGAFMNRSLLEGDPHALLEGMLIGGYAIGAKHGYIYCRAEYPLALERLRVAIGQVTECGFLGDNILGSGFSFHIIIKEGAGAFVCGEETALIASIEGKRGMPRPRPPFPATSGLWGKPTIINNVETLACATLILQNGASWFAQYGTDKSKGTKTFALVGKAKQPGLVEVPLGISLKEMIYEIGGGTLDDIRFKAVQTGGPSGGCVPEGALDTPVDYDSLKAIGTIMGSGGMVVMDENTCMVDFARYFLDFAQKESCGECVPCRLGTKQMLQILEDITKGRGKPEDIDLLLELAEAVQVGSLCGLGQTAPNPVLTTIRYFRDEYEAHVKYQRCPAGVCKEIISSPCQHICPIGTEAPVYIALIAQGRFQEAFDIIRKDNPLPSVCARVCHHPCESKCQAGKWGSPIAVRALKRVATDHAYKAKVYSAAMKEKAIGNGHKVAIIGSGPAGLMAGYELAGKGYDVTIFEALNIPGGALVAYVPEYRLPREILRMDIESIMEAGVKIRTNTRVGDDILFEDLLSNYKAIFVASGAHKSKRLGIPGEDATGVIDAMEFLKDVNLGKKVELGRSVGIIGGGNSAVDAARVAFRSAGCEKTTMIYRRTRAEMPAFGEEVNAAVEEGIQFQFLTAPTKIITEDGRIKGVECIKMELGEVGEGGRKRPVPVHGSEFVIPLETLIVAVGEEPDLSFLGQHHGVRVSQRGTIAVNPETYATSVDGVFAGGDVVTGPNTVIDAMASGKIAAEMIDHYIRGESPNREYKLTRPSVYLPAMELTEQEMEEAERPAMLHLSIQERTKNFREVDLCLTEEMAVREAGRCLRCDLETEEGRKANAAQMAEGGIYRG